MNPPQFTPGPWTFHEQGDANEFCLLTAGGGWVIAFRQNGEMMAEKQRANAQLIAQSPNLHDVLSELVEPDLRYVDGSIVIDCGSHTNAIAKVRQARRILALARGEQ